VREWTHKRQKHPRNPPSYERSKQVAAMVKMAETAAATIEATVKMAESAEVDVTDGKGGGSGRDGDGGIAVGMLVHK
jgi:hypothetical protein